MWCSSGKQVRKESIANGKARSVNGSARPSKKSFTADRGRPNGLKVIPGIQGLAGCHKLYKARVGHFSQV